MAAAGAERGHLCGAAVAGGGGGVPASPALSPEEGAPPSWESPAPQNLRGLGALVGVDMCRTG